MFWLPGFLNYGLYVTEISHTWEALAACGFAPRSGKFPFKTSVHFINATESGPSRKSACSLKESRSGNMSAVAHTLCFSQMCLSSWSTDATLTVKVCSLIIVPDNISQPNLYNCVHNPETAGHVSSSALRLPRKCQTTFWITVSFCTIIPESLRYFHKNKFPIFNCCSGSEMQFIWSTTKFWQGFSEKKQRNFWTSSMRKLETNTMITEFTPNVLRLIAVSSCQRVLHVPAESSEQSRSQETWGKTCCNLHRDI